MPRRPLKPGDIIRLLLKLKAETPEYPADLLKARRATFLKHAITLKIQGKGRGGEGGHQAGGGGMGSTLGGSAAPPSFAAQMLIGLGFVTIMLVGAFLIRDQVARRLDGNLSSAIDGSHEPISQPGTVAEPTLAALPTVYSPASITPDATEAVNAPVVEDDLDSGVTEDPQTNPGLHLGQTPGAPAAPGQGNSGNENQPDKQKKRDRTNNHDR